MKPKLDHIGIAVRDTAAALKFYTDALGLTVAGTEVVADQGVKVTFLPIGDTNIELIEPIDPASATAKFLDTRGEGIHHICLQVESVKDELDKLAGQGFRLVDVVPRRGAHGKQIGFVHPKATSGVLMELSQPGEH